MTGQSSLKANTVRDESRLTRSLVLAGQRVIAQMLGAFLTEGLLPDKSIISKPREQEAGKVKYRCSASSVLYIAEAKRTIAYDRWLIKEGSLWRQAKQIKERCHNPLQMLEDLLPDIVGDDIIRHRFMEEIACTFINHAETLAAEKDTNGKFHALPYDQIEARLTDGHRYHPCFKSRIGFSASDNRAYGPEFAKQIKPVWLAVHESIAQSASIALPNAQDQMLLAQSDISLPEDSYHLLPVHPWQWRMHIEAATIFERAAGRIVVLGEAAHDYLAQQSIRTLADQTCLEGPSLKLALSIRNTSTARTLATHTVLNAPVISSWLDHVNRSDVFMSESGTIMLCEQMGTAVTLPQWQDSTKKYKGAMAAIWRESIHRHLRPGEKAVPFSTLTHLDPARQPAIKHWLQSYGTEKWIRQLFIVAALPVVHLLLKLGIALESHQQNMVLVHENGWPKRIALKDFHDGVRFIPDLLKTDAPLLTETPVEHARVNPNSYVVASDPADVRDFMFDALFGVNLSELAFFLDQHFQFGERTFWRVAGTVIQQHLQSDSDLIHRAEKFRLLDDFIEAEPLARRRLQNGRVPNRRVVNPLVHLGEIRC